jgi:hypothetical protein
VKTEVRERNEETLQAFRDRKEAQAPSEDEQAAEQTASEAYRDLAALAELRYLKPDFSVRAGLRIAEDDEALSDLCDFMSEAAQRQTIGYAEASSGLGGEWSCEKAAALLVRRSNVASEGEGPGKVEVLGVNAVAEKATATVQLDGGPARSVALVREEGEWKLAATFPARR